MMVGVNGGSLKPHDCVARVAEERRIRKGLHTEPLAEADWDLYTDGSSRREAGGIRASYAMVRDSGGVYDTIKSGEIPQPASAQPAEITALTRALELSEGHQVYIFTDSNYAWTAVHVEGTAWVRHGFKTSTGRPVKHDQSLRRLLQAVHRPREVAVVEVQGHSVLRTREALGNDAADRAAKLAVQIVTL
ncbi:ribonuclease H-like, partial [Chiloscyllium plagiosum]|uniref:ribonuclease H-like n=1 Tax=Chiloscyllium plagiosum TaxID=36176 RepID=UPI001CB8529F